MSALVGLGVVVISFPIQAVLLRVMFSAVQRNIRTTILSQWKIDTETLEAIWPKKESITHVKWCVAIYSYSAPLTRGRW